MRPFSMALPKSVAEAAQVGARGFDKAKLLAGGTDLVSEIKDDIISPEVVVNLKRVPGLDKIVETDAALEIGALVTLAEVTAHAEIQKRWPAIAQSLARTATPSLRNVGTVGGNLCQRPRCWYYRHPEYRCLKKGGSTCYAQQGENEFHSVFDNRLCAAVHPSNLAPVLMAHDAELEITNSDGARWISVDTFWATPQQNIEAENILQPGDVLTRVRLPNEFASRDAAYVEVREKESFDWASCGATVRLEKQGGEVTDARVILSAVAPIPLRRRDLEKRVLGKKPNPELLAKLLDLAVQGATPMAHNRYKLTLIRTTFKRALAQAWEGAR